MITIDTPWSSMYFVSRSTHLPTTSEFYESDVLCVFHCSNTIPWINKIEIMIDHLRGMRLFLSCCNGRSSCFISTEEELTEKQQGNQSIHSTPSPYDVKDDGPEEGGVYDGYTSTTTANHGSFRPVRTSSSWLVRGTVACYPNMRHSTRNFVHTGGGDSIDI